MYIVQCAVCTLSQIMTAAARDRNDFTSLCDRKSSLLHQRKIRSQKVNNGLACGVYDVII